MTFLRRIPWFLAGGLVLGIILGLVYSWLIAPVEYVDAAPAALQADFKDQYRELIASAYQADANLELALARLEALGDADPAAALNEQASRALAQNDPQGSAYALLVLAQALQPVTPTMSVSLPTDTPTATVVIIPATMPPSETPSPTPDPNVTPEPSATTDPNATVEPSATAKPSATAEPSATPSTTPSTTPSPTPRPTRTAVPTPGLPYKLLSQEELCDPFRVAPLLQIELIDPSGNPAPGEEIIVLWNSGSDHFFTGLKSELGDGYADFEMTPGVLYTVQIAAGGRAVSDLQATACESGGAEWWGSLLLIFQQQP